jgi:hypothetical protein
VGELPGLPERVRGGGENDLAPFMGLDFPEDALRTARGVPIWRFSRTAGDPHKSRLGLAGFVNWEMWRWGKNGIR